MLTQLFIASMAVVATLLVQVGFIAIAIGALIRLGSWIDTTPRRIATILALTLWVLAGLSTAVWFWALLYIWLGVFESLETSVYFSTVAFTTLGFGDITLDKNWRLMSALMAANGLILFSLNTAFLIEVVRRLWPKPESN